MLLPIYGTVDNVLQYREYIPEPKSGCPEVATENAHLNGWHSIVHLLGDINTVPALMKTAEQRRAELDLI